ARKQPAACGAKARGGSASFFPSLLVGEGALDKRARVRVSIRGGRPLIRRASVDARHLLHKEKEELPNAAPFQFIDWGNGPEQKPRGVRWITRGAARASSCSIRARPPNIPNRKGGRHGNQQIQGIIPCRAPGTL